MKTFKTQSRIPKSNLQQKVGEQISDFAEIPIAFWNSAEVCQTCARLISKFQRAHVVDLRKSSETPICLQNSLSIQPKNHPNFSNFLQHLALRYSLDRALQIWQILPNLYRKDCQILRNVPRFLRTLICVGHNSKFLYYFLGWIIIYEFLNCKFFSR